MRDLLIESCGFLLPPAKSFPTVPRALILKLVSARSWVWPDIR